MYTPKHFEQPRAEIIHDLIRSRPLAALVTIGSAGLNANHIPLLLAADEGESGVLRGHVSRANSVWKDFDSGVDALAIFSGPSAYVTPAWYPSKKVNGEAVPTWNYVVAHVYGRLRAIEDAQWLRSHVDALTRFKEEGRDEPWAVTDAPDAYITKLVAGIVGLEIQVTRMEGKWKVSQNHSEANRAGVVAGLLREGDPESAAMADLVRKRGGV